MRKLWTALMTAAALAGGLLGAGTAEANPDCNPSGCTGYTCYNCDDGTNNFCTSFPTAACELAKNQFKLKHVEIDQYENIYIQGVNVFITDGSYTVSNIDSTLYYATTNASHVRDASGSSKNYQMGGTYNSGIGNLFIGYGLLTNQPEHALDKRDGNSNLLVGDGHNFQSDGGMIAGFENHIRDNSDYSTITGGQWNHILGGFDVVVGGFGNLTTSSTCSGSDSDHLLGAACYNNHDCIPAHCSINTSTPCYANQDCPAYLSSAETCDLDQSGGSYVGGTCGTVPSTLPPISNWAVVVGGIQQGTENDYGTILGGAYNRTTADYASITAGAYNLASGIASFIGGGASGTASGIYANVLGGVDNTATANQSVVVGGTDNETTYAYSAILGGDQNVASGQTSVVVGGSGNEAADNGDVVVGGSSNVADGGNAVVVGGGSNTASSSAVAVGGSNNDAQSGVVVSGSYNVSSGTNACVVGGGGSGTGNVADEEGSVITGTSSQNTSNTYEVIP